MDFDFSRQGNARVFTHFIWREILVLRSEDVKLKDDVVEKRFWTLPCKHILNLVSSLYQLHKYGLQLSLIVVAVLLF